MVKDEHGMGREGMAATHGGAVAVVVETIQKEDADTTTVTTTSPSDKKCSGPPNGTTILATVATGPLVECKMESEVDTKETKGSSVTVGGVVPQAPHIRGSNDCLDTDDPFAMPLGSSSDGVQPLASNVLPKQQATGSMEAQYMQQQSQIFVFSTMLANSAAEEMLQGHYPSIIAYHCAQPGTKKYLEKNPLKVTQFIRHNPAQWLNNLNMMKKGGNNMGLPRSPPLKCGGMGSSGSSSPLVGPPNTQLTQLSGSSNQPGNNSLPPSGSGSTTSSLVDQFLPDSLDDMVGLNDRVDMCWDRPTQSCHPTSLSNCIDPTSTSLPNGLNSDMPCLHPRTSSLQGVKVPDENLTPQQRKHREVQLATLRKMAEIFFRDDDNDPNNAPPPSSGAPGGGCDDVAPPNHNLDPNQAPNDWYSLPRPQMQQPPPQSTRPTQPYGPPSCSSDTGGKSMSAVTSSSSSPISTTAIINRPITVVTAASTTNHLGTTPPIRLPGPPPPYHQSQRSASVPIALQSPSPMSPNNNSTSNLSLPSPKAVSSPDTQTGFNPAPHTFSSGNTYSQRPIATQSGGTVHSPGSPRIPAACPQSSSGPAHSNPSTPSSGQAHLSPSLHHGNSNSSSQNNTTNEQQQVSSTITSTTSILPIGAPPTNHQENNSMFDCHAAHPMNQLQKHPQLQSMNNHPNKNNGNNNNVSTGNVCNVVTTAAVSSCHTNAMTTAQEPNLMPVPSPQQIQYLNAFEGQELIIQKQPNISLNDNNIISSPAMPTTIDSGFSNNNAPPPAMVPHTRLSAPNTPTSMEEAMVGGGGPTPVSVTRFPHLSADSCHYQIPSPHTPVAQNPNLPDKSRLTTDSVPLNANCAMNMSATMPGMVTKGAPSNNMGVPISSAPHSHFDPISSLAQMSQQLTNSVSSHSLGGQMHSHQSALPPHAQQTGHPPLPAPHHHLHPPHPHQMMNHYVGSSPMSHMMDMGGPPPNSIPSHCMSDLHGPHMMPGPAPPPNHSMHPAAQFHQHSHHGFHHGQGGSSKCGPPFGLPSSQLMSRNMHQIGPPVPTPPPNHAHNPPHPQAHDHPNSYNGANIQVKPTAPNTIQYLPAKSQADTSSCSAIAVSQSPNSMANVCPQPRPEFMHRFQNPSDANKMPSHNLQYFPSSGGHMLPMNQTDQSPNHTLPPQAAMMRSGPLPPHNPHFHPHQPPVGMRPLMRMPHYNGPIRSHHHAMDGPPNMYNPAINSPYVTTPKVSPLTSLDGGQPLPPSTSGMAVGGPVTGAGGVPFKGSSPFLGGGPTTADPTYADQFHNFQKQLYATRRPAVGATK